MSLYKYYLDTINGHANLAVNYTFTHIEDITPMIEQLAIQELSQAQSVCIQVADEYKDTLLTFLERINIPYAMLDHTPEFSICYSGSINQEEAYKLKANMKSIEQFYKPIFGEWSMYDLTKIILEAKTTIEPYPFWVPDLSFEFTPQEYAQIREAIVVYKEFNRFFNQDALRAQLVSKYNELTIENTHPDQLYDQIRLLLEELLAIKKGILSRMNAIKNQSHRALSQASNLERATVNEQILLMKAFITQHGDAPIEKPGLITLNKALKHRYKAWLDVAEQLQLATVENNPMIHLNELEYQYEEVKKAHEEKIAHLVQDLKGITALNCKDQILSFHLQQLDQWIIKINKMQLFKQVVEHNTNNISKLIYFIDGLHQDLHIFTQYRSIRSLVKWSHLSKQMTTGWLKFFDQLKANAESDWNGQFDYFYFTHLFGQQASIGIERQRPEIIMELKQEIFHNIKSRWQQVLNDYLEYTKKEDKSTYHALIQQTKSWRQMWLEQHPIPKPPLFIGSIDQESIGFPTITISQGQLKLTEDSPTRISPPSRKLTTPLHLTPVTEQLQKAKTLAAMLHPYVGQAMGYQVKAGNFIINLDPFYNTELITLLEEQHAKKFDISTQDQLTDFLLSSNRAQYFVLQDGLLDPKLGNYHHQWLTISNLEACGFIILSLDTYGLLSESNQYLMEEIGKIFETKKLETSAT